MYIHYVTLGTMSGGGTKVMKGRMSSKVHSDFTPQQLVHLEDKLKEDEESAEVRRIDHHVVFNYY